MRPNSCVNFYGNGYCDKSNKECVETKGIYCTVYDPVESDEEEEE